VNGHLKEQYGLELALNEVRVRAITRHVLWMMLVAHIVAMERLQPGVMGDLLSTTHLHREGKKTRCPVQIIGGGQM
jgi:hypothetical protein